MSNITKVPEIYNLSMRAKNEIIEQFTSAVTSTMGPGGHTVILNRDTDGIPHVTKDGVSVAESINTGHPVSQAIISLIKESARKTARQVGDGTTTSTLLAAEFCKLAEEMIVNYKMSHRDYFNAVEEVVSFLWEKIRDLKVEIDDPSSKLLDAIINISCNSDKYLTGLIKEATEIAGKDGSIQVEVADSKESVVTSTNGALLETRTDAREKIVLDGVILVLIEGKINDGYEIAEVMQWANANERPLVIIAQEFSDAVKRVAQVNRGRNIQMYLVEAEGFADSRLEILKDISAVTEQPIYSTAGGTDKPLSAFEGIQTLIPQIVLTNREVVITPSNEDMDYSDVIAIIKEKMDGAPDQFKRFLQMRLNKYVKTAIIHVGGSTEAEANERKDRIDDAIAAVESAFNHGIVPGGGVALLKLLPLMQKRFKDVYSDEFLVAFNSVLWAPYDKIRENAGFIETCDLIQVDKPNITFNSITGEYVDCYEAGIVDPAEVLSIALINASAVAKTVMNSKYQLTGIQWPSEEK